MEQCRSMMFLSYQERAIVSTEDSGALQTLLPWGGGGAFVDLFPELHDPQSRVDVVEIDQAIVRLRAPRERQVRTEALGIAGPDARDLAALPVKIAAQLARHIDDTPAAAVVTEVHHLVLDPHIVRAAFGHRILRDFMRIVDVRNVDHMNYTAHGNALRRLDVEHCRKYFITDEDVVAIAIDRVCSGEPPVAVELVVIETILADKLRTLRTAALDSRANVENHEAIVPVSQIREAVFNL